MDPFTEHLLRARSQAKAARAVSPPICRDSVLGKVTPIS